VNDRQLANAAAVYFGGRQRAAHVLTCDHCHVDDHGRHVLCPRHPDRRQQERR
jgi:hypothetical protein